MERSIDEEEFNDRIGMAAEAAAQSHLLKFFLRPSGNKGTFVIISIIGNIIYDRNTAPTATDGRTDGGRDS